MKRIISVLISIFIPCVIIAQVQAYEQKGIVRSQSFVSKKGKGIIGAIISSGNRSAISQNTPQDGFFKLPIVDKSKVYYISSVKGPKGSQYKLMYPQADERLEFTPNAPLTIIMQSEKEMQDFINATIATMRRDLDRQLQDSVKVIEQLKDAKKILDEEYNQLYNRYYDLCSDNKKLLEEYIKNIAQCDFESLASSQKEIDMAIASGNYNLAKSLLVRMGTIEDIINDIKNDSLKLTTIRTAETLTEDEIIRKKENAIFICDRNIAASLGSLKNDSIWKYKTAKLRIEPFNVNFLCECGEFAELYYNKYNDAKEYYLRALEQAKIQDLSIQNLSICHNHLGDVYNSLSEYATAEEHYTQARLILESTKGEPSKEVYDSYLGLGNVSYPQAKFDESLTFYRKCVNPVVASINRKAFWQGRIGVGRIKLAKGDYHGAKSDFSVILGELASMQDVDVVTLSMAYSSMIECMTTIGKYQAVIDSCDAAIKIIKKHSSPKNTYIADLLVHQGNAYINIGKIREGGKCMNEAMEIYTNILGENHPNYASACVMFANYYNLVGELRKSEEMNNKALSLLEKKFGKNHLTTVAAHLSKFQLYQTCADFDKAHAELDTIKTIWKSSGLLNDYNRIQINISEGALKIAQGEESKVLKIYQEAIDCVTKTLGKESVQLISLYNQIAMTYLGQQENDRAKNYLDKAQSLANLIYGVDSPAAIMQQMGMGQYYINRGDYHKAYNLYSKIERTAVEIFGADNHQLCIIYNMLGDHHLGQYQFDKAKYYYDKLYEIVRNTYGENHYFVAEPITKIGAYYIQTGDFYKGLEKEQQAYSILSNHFDVGHKATLQSQLGICSAYIQLGQFDQAESVITELSKAVEKELGKNHFAYSNVLQIKATLHQSKGEFSNGIKCLEEAIRITESIYSLHHLNTMQLYRQMSEMFSNLCNFPKAIEYNDVAIAIAMNYYGKDNVGVMPFLLEKGQLYANLNKIGKAHKVYDKVKNTYISHYGDSCMQINPVLVSEAELLMQEGYGEQALEILKPIEVQMISVYGENSLLLCGVYNSLADAYGSVLQFEKAREYYQKSLDIVKKSLGEYNVNCIKPLVGLGNVCISVDVTGQQIIEATRLFDKASFISLSVYGSNNVNTALTESYLGKISLRQENLQDAFKKFQNYNTRVIQAVGKIAHTGVAYGHVNMGDYYIAKAKEALSRQDSINTHSYALHAMEEYVKAKEVTEEIYGIDCAGIANILNYIAQAHLALQQPDSARTTYIKAAELTIRLYGKQSPLVAQAYATLGAAYKYESDQIYLGDKEKLNEAKESFLKAISIRENSKGNSKEILMASTMDWRMVLSSIYMKLNDYNNAFRTIDKIIKELEDLKLENKYRLYNCYYTKASMIVESEGDAKDALEFLVKAKDIFSLLTFPNCSIKEMQQFQLLFALGNVYEKMGMHDEAVENFKNAYDKLSFFSNNTQVELMKQGISDKIQKLENE